MEEGKIRISHLVKSYGEHTVISDFSAEFEKGKTTCIMAPSGQGRRPFCGFWPDWKSRMREALKGLEGMNEEHGLSGGPSLRELSAAANIRLVRQKKPWGKDPKEVREIREAMRAAGLSGCEDQPVRELSGGMKRRVALLRALGCKWDILFLDEPFKGLDEETKDRS